ncbi:hypothetical protein WN51_09889 [Melipona quadrifasciata]|uniref:Uncharacterized protein n=1 Tax=Melipona quadrifasciata TaxID=166423 RepID=A0A0M9AAB1_9HYME|nr:hypothetical protein WN51_09889 [Melipona quadrifasciata]
MTTGHTNRGTARWDRTAGSLEELPTHRACVLRPSILRLHEGCSNDREPRSIRGSPGNLEPMLRRVECAPVSSLLAEVFSTFSFGRKFVRRSAASGMCARFVASRRKFFFYIFLWSKIRSEEDRLCSPVFSNSKPSFSRRTASGPAVRLRSNNRPNVHFVLASNVTFGESAMGQPRRNGSRDRA